MKNSVLVEMNVWQLARFCDCLEIYCYRSGGSLDGLIRAIAEWAYINGYTRFALDDVEEVLLRMCRVPHMQEKYQSLIDAIEKVKAEII